MEIKEKVYELIKKYQETVEEGVKLLKKYLNFDQATGSWRMKGIPPEGDLGPNAEYHYFFHGGGVHMKIKAIVIDWDYGEDGRYDGFNAHRLSELAKQLKGFEYFLDPQKVQTILDDLKNEGVIENRQIVDQYYFIKK